MAAAPDRDPDGPLVGCDVCALLPAIGLSDVAGLCDWVIARKRASLSRKLGPTSRLFWLTEGALIWGRDRPGTLRAGASLRRATGGSAGRICSSIRERGACLTWVALLLRCFVGTARTLFLFVAVNMLFFFFASLGLPKAQGDIEDDDVGEPPNLRSYEAYRCLAVGLSRGRPMIRRSVTSLALFS